MTYGTKDRVIAFLLYLSAASWILNIWNVWVHNFKVPGAEHAELGRIFCSKDTINYKFSFPTDKSMLNNKAQPSGRSNFVPV